MASGKITTTGTNATQAAPVPVTNPKIITAGGQTVAQVPPVTNPRVVTTSTYRPSTAATTPAPAAEAVFTPSFLPSIEAVVSNVVASRGGTVVEVTGSNFSSSPSVVIGGVACPLVEVVSPTKLRVTTPAMSIGTYDLAVTTYFGEATLAGAVEVWDLTGIAGLRIYSPEQGVTDTPISAWIDQGAGGKNLAQAVALNQPILAARRLAGRHALVCDGVTNASYLALAVREACTLGKSVVWVSKHTSTRSVYAGGYSVPLAVVDDTDPGTFQSGPGFSGGKLTLSNYSNIGGAWQHKETADNGYNDGTPRVYAMTHDAVSGDIKFYVNGVQVGTTLNSDFDATHVKWNAIGAGNGPLGSAFQGEIGPVLIKEGVLSTLEVVKATKVLRGQFVYGSTSFERTAPTVAWGPRDGARLVASRNGFVYMVGGWNPGAFPGPSDVTNEIWRSPASDLVTWTKIHDHTAVPVDNCFKPAHYMPVFAMVIGNTEYLYVLGSDMNTDATERRTVRRCSINSNGSLGAWEVLTTTAPWDGALSLHAGAVYGAEIHVLGGQTDLNDHTTASKKHYKSTDGGATWTTLTDFPGAARGMFDLVEWNGQLWMACGGQYGPSGTYYNGVFSYDGTSWSTVLADGAGTVSARRYHSMVVFDNRLWIFSGTNGSNISDAWSSVDGTTWVQQTIAPWTAAHADGVCVLSDCIVFGPGNGTITDGAGHIFKVGVLPFAA